MSELSELQAKRAARERRREQRRNGMATTVVTRSEKRCPKCDTTKAITEFNRNTGKADGRQAICKACQAEAHAERSAELVPEVPDSKRCAHCDETKPAEEFNRNRRSKDGLQSYCRPCQSERRYGPKNEAANQGEGDDTTTTEAPAPAGGPVVEPEPAAETGRDDDGANGAPESRPVALTAAIEHLVAHRGDLLDQRDFLDAEARRIDAELEAVETALTALRSTPEHGDTP